MFNFVRSREGLPYLGFCGQYTTVVQIWEVLLWLRLPYLTDKTKQNSGSCSKLRRKGIPRSRQQPRKRQRTVKRHLTKRSAKPCTLSPTSLSNSGFSHRRLTKRIYFCILNAEPEGCLTAASAVLVNAELDGSEKSLKGA